LSIAAALGLDRDDREEQTRRRLDSLPRGSGQLARAQSLLLELVDVCGSAATVLALVSCRRMMPPFWTFIESATISLTERPASQSLGSTVHIVFSRSSSLNTLTV
jgi:hypothetical protein